MNCSIQDKIDFANISFKGLTKDIIFDETDGLTHITTVNAEFIVLANRDERFRRILNKSKATFDGQWPFIIAKLKNLFKSFKKISGSDLIFDIIQLSKERNYKVFLLGDTPEVNSKAVRTIEGVYNIVVAGYSPPFQAYPFEEEINNMIFERIAKFSPHFLLVGFGAPKQEFWIDDYEGILREMNIKYAIGVGGTFRFIANFEARAPKWISTLGLEGVWRVIQNPKRLRRFFRSVKFIRYI